MNTSAPPYITKERNAPSLQFCVQWWIILTSCQCVCSEGERRRTVLYGPPHVVLVVLVPLQSTRSEQSITVLVIFWAVPFQQTRMKSRHILLVNPSRTCMTAFVAASESMFPRKSTFTGLISTYKNTYHLLPKRSDLQKSPWRCFQTIELPAGNFIQSRVQDWSFHQVQTWASLIRGLRGEFSLLSLMVQK